MKRHVFSVRLWHWLNLVSVVVLFMSGLNISNAHRYLYWGKWGFSPDQAWLAVPRFPGWATIPNYYSLASARDWHILMAWPFSLGLLFMWIAMLVNRHFWRDLRTDRREYRPKAIRADVINHLKLNFNPGSVKYNFLQRMAYGAVLGVLLPGMIFSGLAISPGFESAAPWLVETFGGRQSARSIHFIFAWGIFAFSAVHIVLVLLTGPTGQIRAMITGGEVIKGGRA